MNMDKNNISWNETLKFSWGHIIAFIAIIFISYVAYMGEFYNNGGDFGSAALKVFLMDVLLFVAFIGAQIFKGAERKFNRSIVIERLLISLCPIVFIIAMTPYNHFWNVYAQRDEISEEFSEVINVSRQLFDDYEDYSIGRINAYDKTLDSIIRNKEKFSKIYAEAGFTRENAKMRKNVFVEVLQLQLLSKNTEIMSASALSWIEDADTGATVWNAFLIGNIEEISSAIKEWNKQLYEMSLPVVSNEDIFDDVLPFDKEQRAFNAANEILAGLKAIYKNSSGFKVISLLTAIILFLMLLFPYFLQSRNTRAEGLYHLIPRFDQKATSRYESSGHSVEDDSWFVDTSEQKEAKRSSSGTSSVDDDIFAGTF